MTDEPDIETREAEAIQALEALYAAYSEALKAIRRQEEGFFSDADVRDLDRGRRDVQAMIAGFYQARGGSD
jgi:hypothetical protein